MYEEKQRTIYKVMATSQLKDLARDFREMKEEAIPILFDELNTRGEYEFVEEIKKRIASAEVQTEQKEESFLENLIQPELSSKIIKSRESENILDDGLIVEETKKLTNQSDFDIVASAVKIILKNKSKLNSKKEAFEKVREEITLKESLEIQVIEKLTKRKNNSLIFGGIVAAVFAIGLLVFVSSEGQSGFVPGILILILGGSSLNTGMRLKKILEN